MDYNMLNWGLMIVTFAVMIGIGALSSRRVSDSDEGGFLLAGRTLGPFVGASTIVATGIETIVGRLHTLWPKTPVLVLTIPPRGADFHALDDRRLELNGAIATLGRRMTNVYAVTIDDDAFTCGQYRKPRATDGDASTRLSCANYADDNLHFSTAGYVALGQALQTAAKASLGKDVFR